MPKQVTLYRLFVASPGDCHKEREIVRQLVEDWNVAYGHSCNVLLEPVLWETHAHPELGERPQAIINRQILTSCDLLIGVFRSRIGTRTGAASSGTVEEIDQFRRAKKPILLYFFTGARSSRTAIGADDQVAQYRDQVGSNGLVWPYRGLLEFTTDVAKHIALTMAELAGTPKVEATRSPEVGIETTTPAPDQPVDPLRNIREHTYFVWGGLEALEEGQTSFSCEIRQVTLERVRRSLDSLAEQGFLKYDTELAYVTSFDEMPVLTIKLTDISDRLRVLVNELQPGPG